MLGEKESIIESANSVIKLFYYMKETYTIFEDVDLQIEYNGRNGTQTSIWTNYKNDKGEVIINMGEADFILRGAMGIYLKKEYENLKKINPNLSYTQFALLHELGHYLHRVTDPDDFESKQIEKEIILRKFYLAPRTPKLNWYFYRSIPLETLADNYSKDMAKVLLTDKNFEDYTTPYTMKNYGESKLEKFKREMKDRGWD